MFRFHIFKNRDRGVENSKLELDSPILFSKSKEAKGE